MVFDPNRSAQMVGTSAPPMTRAAGSLPRRLFFPIALALSLFLPVLVVAAEPGSPLIVARWRVEALAASRQGLCCWVTGPDGVFRLEVTAPQEQGAPLPPPAALLGWEGDGWTLILGEPGQGTLNRWHREWRKSPPGLEDWVRGSLGRFPDANPASFEGADSRPPANRWRAAPAGHSGPAAALRVTLNWETPQLKLEGDPATGGESGRTRFRGRMTERGRGRGGAREIVRLEFLIPGPASRPARSWPVGTVMMLSSSRRPGTLRIEVLDRLDQSLLPVEAFLPLWPLNEFLPPTGLFQGTPPGVEGF